MYSSPEFKQSGSSVLNKIVFRAEREAALHHRCISYILLILPTRLDGRVHTTVIML